MAEINWQAVSRSEVHPLKAKMLEVFADGEVASPNGLSKKFDAPLGNVSYHVKSLEKAGFIALDHTEPRRGAVEHFYKISKAALIKPG